ncbi:MAG: hypothetical protein ABFS21_02885 [Actinomycetota bacterium]
MSRRRWILFVTGLGLLSLFFLGSWTRPGPSAAMCSSCHAMEPSAASAANSVHADVPCLACHTRTGLAGAVTYVPILATEVVQNLTGWSVMYDDLDPRSCVSCHHDLTGGPLLEVEHPGPDADCATCHGNAAHPTAEAVADPEKPHPLGFDLTHGREAVNGSAECAECHEVEFCVACHSEGSFPHADGWVTSHGDVQTKEGALGCAMCHTGSFCSSCHGTEIPHADDWFEIHYRAVEGSQSSACVTCHPANECAQCHARHAVHREQSIYEWEMAP